MSNLDDMLEANRREFRALVSRLVNDRLAELGMSDAEFASQAKIDPQVVDDLFKESRDLTQEELQKISHALKIRWE